MSRARIVMIAFVMLAAVVPGALSAEGTRYGDLEFPADEHQHLDGWDWWWGAADLVTASGNRYTVGIAFVSLNGYGITGHQVFPHQGPYEGLSIMTPDGPQEWGHPGETPGRFVRRISTYVPGMSELLRYETLDTSDGLKDIGRWERTSLETESYRFRLDQDAARVHPTGESVRLGVDLEADMQGPPLLAGGTGTWWYGIPETYGYPSSSFQYMQAAATVSGTLVLEQPDGSLLEETVVPEESSLLIVHEYDATPVDIPVGLALAQSSQLHSRYAQYYQGGMPWELIFVDLRNGAQLMLAVLAFHSTPEGIAPVAGLEQPTYRVMATLRLPTGESVPLDDEVHVEHLSYRTVVGRVPTFMVQTTGIWKQAWEYRVSHPGGTATKPDGATVDIPAFDLGVVPQFAQDEPAADDRGNRLAQRLPFSATGSYAGCPVSGFGWGEIIVNWYGYEDRDPWFTGGGPPPVPPACGAAAEPPPSEQQPPPDAGTSPPVLAPEGCGAWAPGPSTCEYEAVAAAGVGGYGSAPGGWTVTITRPGVSEPIVVRSFGGFALYACGTILPGDHVVTEAQPGSGVFAGNPGICY